VQHFQDEGLDNKIDGDGKALPIMDAFHGASFVKISSVPHEVIYNEQIKNPCCLDFCDTNRMVDVFVNQA
jgi:hypothetical protein